jgi:hypothetical protein
MEYKLIVLEDIYEKIYTASLIVLNF